MLGHKMKPIGDLSRIWYIDSGPISGDIYDTTADASLRYIFARDLKRRYQMAMLAARTSELAFSALWPRRWWIYRALHRVRDLDTVRHIGVQGQYRS